MAKHQFWKTQPIWYWESMHGYVQQYKLIGSFLLIPLLVFPAQNNLVLQSSISSRHQRRAQELLTSPVTRKEQILMNVLHESCKREIHQHGVLVGLQLSLILQTTYSEKMRNQIAALEMKTKKKKHEQLIRDGLPRLLTGDVFMSEATHHYAAANKRNKAKKQNKRKREDAAKEMEKWKYAEGKRKKVNKEKTNAYREELEKWEDK